MLATYCAASGEAICKQCRSWGFCDDTRQRKDLVARQRKDLVARQFRMRRVESEFSVFQIGFLRIHAAQDGTANLVLGRHDFFCLRYHFPGNIRRQHHDTITIAQNVVAAADGDSAYRNRLPETIGNPSGDDIGGRVETAKYRKTDLENKFDVTAAPSTTYPRTFL